MALNNFQFNTTPGLRFGIGQAKASCKEIFEKLGSRILFITDKGLMSLGLTKPTIEELKKKSPEKSGFSHFLIKFEENIVFYRGKWASRADSIVFYSEFTRPEGTENHGPCGQNLGKT